MSPSTAAFDKTAVDCIRMFSADMVEAAKSGHPGAPIGCAPMAHVLWSETMSYSPANPRWINRDRFVLSNGHACALQYAMLHLSGYAVSKDDCTKFRQVESITPGHPENFMTPGVEVCTGPLGQGLTNAVGMAMSEKHLGATYNQPDFPVIDHFTYVICGDGCLQEGITAESSSLAGHLGLGKLIVLYDDNNITIDGGTDLSFTEDVGKRYESYDWHVQSVADISNLDNLRDAIAAAKADPRPSMIKVKTIIGHGAPKQGTSKVHGAPLGAEDLATTKKGFGLDPEKSFFFADEVVSHYKSVTKRVEEGKVKHDALLKKYKTAFPDLHKQFERQLAGELPAGLIDALPSYNVGDATKATRQISQAVLNEIAPALPELIGGSADLTPSNLTALACSGDFQKDTPAGRYVRFGVREHAMAGICNGMFAYGMLRPFCATFLNFAGYALGSIRLSALSKFGVIYICTHDSIGQGEDGPTHQPVEMLESLRSMPNINVMRPCDGNETSAAYQVALESRETPTILCLTRQGAPIVQGTSKANALKGGYVCSDTEGAGDVKLILAATGSEVNLVHEAAKVLAAAGIKTRVVSMPCQEIFDAQSAEYKAGVWLNGEVPVMSVEAAATHGWDKYSHAQIGMERFGASGKGAHLFEKFGFTVDNVVKQANAVVKYYEAKSVPNLLNKPVFENFVTGH